MANTTTQSQAQNATNNNVEAGAAWIKKDKNGVEYLSILLNNQNLNGFQTREKKTEKSPDLNLVQFKSDGESELVGAIWIGETKSGRTKLTIKTNDGVYYTAVKRDIVENQKEGRADYTIFAPNEKNEAQSADES